MNYETANKIDLNKRLAELLGVKFRVDGDKLILAIKHECSNVISIEGVVDYCTDWNATMPLAVEHGVSILIGNDNYNHATTDAYKTYEPHGMNSSDGYFCVRINDKSEALRAIVICLIKVLESKQ